MLLLAITAAGANAQTVLQLPAGTRALGVGDAFVAGRGSEVLFYNPAMLALLPGLTASVQRYGDASTHGAVSSVFSGGRLAAGVGAQLLDYGAGAAPGGGTRLDLATRGPEASASTSMALAAAMTIKGIRMGAAAKYVEERVAASRDGGAAFDLGAAKDFFGRSTFGLALQNLGGSLDVAGERRDLPFRATLGAAAFTPPIRTFFDLAATAAITYRRDGAWIPAGGVELTYVPLDGWAFTGRVGARRISDDFGGKPLTLGAGVAFDRLALDYAYHALETSASTHRVGIRIR